MIRRIKMNGICETEFGTFKVKMEGDNINVGGKNFCVNLALYKKETSLYWLKTDAGGCELHDKEIHGVNTVKMTDLSFSLLRKYHPERNTFVTLLDDSGFSWKDQKGKTYKTNFLKGYLLLHGKTWYEDKFNATMCDPDIYRIYRDKVQKNFDDPAKKPPAFNFMSSEIQEKLEPLYVSSKTWREFIHTFLENYEEVKYKMMYGWYRNAIYSIFDGMEINQNWKIDISKRQHIECISPVIQKGGHTTKKNRRFTFSNYKKLEPFSWSPS